MKLNRSLIPALALALASAASLSAESAPAPAAAPKPRVASSGGVSPHETTSTVIGVDRRTGNRVTITYGRPFSKDPKTGEIRKIWGGLVKWDKADRLGADEATLLLTQQPIQFGETVIQPGAYTLYLIPSETGTSKLAFSSNLGKWGVPVDETHDVARIDLTKENVETAVDQLTLAVVNNKETGAGMLTITWENIRFSAPFTNKK